MLPDMKLSVLTCALWFIAAALLSIVTGGCEKKDSASRTGIDSRAPVPVVLRQVRVQGVQRQIEVVGTLYGDEDTTVSAKVPGKIVELTCDMGDRVKSGEKLAQIETTDYELAVTQRQLAVRESLAKVGLTQLPADSFDPASVPTVLRAKVQAENAEAKFNRGKMLFEQSSPRISQQEFDDLRTALEVAQRDYDVAVLTARAVVEEARARQGDLLVAQQRLRDASITAPSSVSNETQRSYTVAARMFSVGEYVKEGDRLYRLVDDSIVKLRAAVPERFADQIKVGQKVTIQVESASRQGVGQIARINSQIDPASRTFEIEVVVPNSDRVFKPGAFVRAFIQTHIDKDVVFVPREAVLSFAGVSKVFLVADGKAREVRVDLGGLEGDWVEIVKGLKAGESVVVEGTNKLATGVPVEVKMEATQRPVAPSLPDAASEGSARAVTRKNGT